MDEIIEKVGNFGPFQALVFASATASLTSGVMGMMFMMYGMYNPGWTCLDNAVGTETSRNGSIGLQSSDYTNAVSQDNCTLWRMCNNVVYDDSSSTVVTEWNLKCDHEWIASLMITVQMCGVLFGSWACGPLGDRYGRKVSLFTSIAIHGIANLVSAFSSSWKMFAAFRFFIGVGVGGILSVAFVFPLEFVGNWWRPVLMSVPSWSVGVVQFATVSFAFKDWAQIHLATAGLSALAFIPVFWVPESMRWLAVNGKEDTIHTVVSRMARWNRKPPVDVGLINKAVRTIVECQKNESKPTYLDLFKTTKLRGYSIKFGLTWFMIAMIYYMISFGVKSTSGNFYTNMIVFALTEIPCNLLVGPFSNKFGRRFSARLFLCLSALTCVGSLASHFLPEAIAGTFSVTLITVSKGSLMAAWTFVIVLSAELYPTVVRNLQSGYLNSVCRFGGMVSPYMIPSDDSKVFISFLVAGGLLIACTVLMASVPDSKERRMADTIQEMKHPARGDDSTEETAKMNHV